MYPTKEEILKTPFPFQYRMIDITANWRKKYLKNILRKDENTKLTEITELLLLLAPSDKPAIELGATYCYHPPSKTIFLDKSHASVISALHELGHHLYGPSELEACRFSVWLFKTIFPEFYEKLTWVGHLLVKNKQ